MGAAAPTFTKDAPIFYRHCVECHHPNDIAPMSLVDFQSARPWARPSAKPSSRARCHPVRRRPLREICQRSSAFPAEIDDSSRSTRVRPRATGAICPSRPCSPKAGTGHSRPCGRYRTGLRGRARQRRLRALHSAHELPVRHLDSRRRDPPGIAVVHHVHVNLVRRAADGSDID